MGGMSSAYRCHPDGRVTDTVDVSFTGGKGDATLSWCSGL